MAGVMKEERAEGRESMKEERGEGRERMKEESETRIKKIG